MYGTFPLGPVRQWPIKEPDDSLDYTWDMTPDLTLPVTGLIDPIINATLCVRPSGAGEIVASRLSVDATGCVVTVWLAGGVPGRSYIVSTEGVTAAGRVHQWLIGLLIDPALAVFPVPVPPFAGFGPPLTWAADGGGFDFDLEDRSGELLLEDASGYLVQETGSGQVPPGGDPTLAFDFDLEDSSGELLLEDTANYLIQEASP